MKRINEKSIGKSLRIALDCALILQAIVIIYAFITGVGLLNSHQGLLDSSKTDVATMSSGIGNIMIALQNPDLGKYIESVSYKFHLYILLYGFLMLITLTLITLQLRLIFKSFIRVGYFDQSNPLRIKKIAIIVFTWVIVDYALRFLPQMIIPDYLISSSVGLNSFTQGSSFGIFGFDLKMLVVAIIIYLLYIVYNFGTKLKEEAALTI